MGDGRLSTETPAGVLDGTELLEVTQSGNTRVTTAQDIADLSTGVTSAGASGSTTIVGDRFGGASIKIDTADTGQNYLSGAVISFDSEVYDTDGFADLVSDATRLTVPAGVSKVRVHAQYSIGSLATGQYTFAKIQKNGANLDPSPSHSHESGVLGSDNLSFSSAPLVVSQNDYFTFTIFCEDTSVDLNECALSIEVVEWDIDYSRVHNLAIQAPFGGAMVELTSDLTSINPASVFTIDWDAASYDTNSFWSATNPERLTIPSGVSKVKVGATIRVANLATGADFQLNLRVNGSVTKYAPNTSERYHDIDLGLVVSSGPLEVSAGDYITTVIYSDDTSIDVTANRCNFWIEVVEWDTTQYPTSNAVLAVQTKTDVANFDALTGVCYLVTTTAGQPITTVDLPAPVTGGDRVGIKYVSQNSSSDSVSINPSSAQDIDGNTADVTLTADGEYIELISAGDGVNWYIVSRVV